MQEVDISYVLNMEMSSSAWHNSINTTKFIISATCAIYIIPLIY